jgi:hypothetical protein
MLAHITEINEKTMQWRCRCCGTSSGPPNRVKILAKLDRGARSHRRSARKYGKCEHPYPIQPWSK